MKKLTEFLDEKKIEYYSHHTIAQYTTMRIAGKAGCLIIARNQTNLEELLGIIDASQIPFILLGGGSNVVFTGDCPQTAVIINRTSEIDPSAGDHLVKLNSGVFNKDFLSVAMAKGMGGLEFLAGIPGTVGGAAAVNAGAFGGSMDTVLTGADVFTPGVGTRTVDKDYFQFQYRNSIFKYGNEVIINLYLKYTDAMNDEIRKKVKANIKHRQEKHPPFNLSTAGCFFKNPFKEGQKLSAGQLIEDAGFKGATYNGLAVSHQHANFIVNSHDGSFSDITALETEIIRKVWEQNAVKLEREVIYINPDGKKL